VAGTVARAVSTGLEDWIGIAVIFPIAMLVKPYGAQQTHKLNKRQLEIGGCGVSAVCVGAVFLEFGGVRGAVYK
jgi:hypothetical protein